MDSSIPAFGHWGAKRWRGAGLAGKAVFPCPAQLAGGSFGGSSLAAGAQATGPVSIEGLNTFLRKEMLLVDQSNSKTCVQAEELKRALY